MENLHSDITLDILSRLPIESTLQSKRVCKTWRTLVGDTKVGLLFAIAFHKILGSGVQLYYGEQYDEINFCNGEQDYSYKTLTKIDHGFIERSLFHKVMVGSCNGLVCLVVFHHDINDPVYICNPVTGEHVHLPWIDLGGINTAFGLSCVASGFGYVHSTNDYKVVRISYDFKQPKLLGKVQVYTLGGGCGWRNKEDITYYFRNSGIFAHGALHWMECREKCKIVAFDLEDEEFHLLPSPPCDFRSAEVGLLLLGGNLCVCLTYRGKCLDIWALKKNKKRKNSSYNVKEQEYHCWSWSREFNIVWEGDEDTVYEPFALTKSNEVLLTYNRILSCYDPKTTTLKKLWDEDTRRLDFQVIPHMNSLVSLKALGEESDKEEIISAR